MLTLGCQCWWAPTCKWRNALFLIQRPKLIKKTKTGFDEWRELERKHKSKPFVFPPPDQFQKCQMGSFSRPRLGDASPKKKKIKWRKIYENITFWWSTEKKQTDWFNYDIACGIWGMTSTNGWARPRTPCNLGLVCLSFFPTEVTIYSKQSTD